LGIRVPFLGRLAEFDYRRLVLIVTVLAAGAVDRSLKLSAGGKSKAQDRQRVGEAQSS